MKLIHALALVFAGTAAVAQDVHFSQMAFTPLAVNPALAGANHSLQGIINYRSQWSSVTDPFTTAGFSVDGRVTEPRRNADGHFALGVGFFNDRAAGQITTNTGSLNAAYHIRIDESSTFGVGIYTGVGQRSTDAMASGWGSQFTGTEYIPSLPSGESITRNQFVFFDAGFGGVYRYSNETSTMSSNDARIFQAGLALYHLNRPGYSFLENDDVVLPIRYSLFANAVVGVSNTNLALMPGLYIQRQRSAQEILLGSYFRYTINEGSRATGLVKQSFFSLGTFYRVGDAIALKAMFDYFNYSIGASYDFTASPLSRTAGSTGAMEVMLRFRI